jgi:hypothetical protein
MNFVLQPWQLPFVILAGWVNRQQQEVIQYLRTENQVLREKCRISNSAMRIFSPQGAPPGPGAAPSRWCNSARAIKGAIAKTVAPGSGTADPTMPAERMAMAVGRP